MKTLEQVDVISPPDRSLLAEVRDTVRRFLPNATVLLYGSVARGTQTPESDYDILVLTDAPLSREEEERVDRAVYDIELAHERVVSVLYYAKDEWTKHSAMPLHVEVARDGIVV